MRKVSIRDRKPHPAGWMIPPDYPDGSIQLVSLVKSKALLEPVDLAAGSVFGTR